MMTKEQEIKRINALLEKLDAESVHHLHMATQALWMAQTEERDCVLFVTSGELIDLDE